MKVTAAIEQVEVKPAREAVNGVKYTITELRGAIIDRTREVVELEPAKPAEYAEEVTLKLPREVAETLHAVTASVGGSPTLSRRKHMDLIRIALYDAGLYNKEAHVSKAIGRGVYFHDEAGV